MHMCNRVSGPTCIDNYGRDFSTIPFELVFIEKGVYDMGDDFISHMTNLGVSEAAEIGGLPSWSLLLRRK